MYPLAAATLTAADRLRQVPGDFWVRVAIGIVALVLVVFFLRKVAKMNKVVVAVIVLFCGSMLGFTWIYERNEPAWATPAVGWLAGFFPSKAKLAQR